MATCWPSSPSPDSIRALDARGRVMRIVVRLLLGLLLLVGLLIWVLLNCFWLVLLRRPAISGALSLTVISNGPPNPPTVTLSNPNIVNPTFTAPPAVAAAGYTAAFNVTVLGLLESIFRHGFNPSGDPDDCPIE